MKWMGERIPKWEREARRIDAAEERERTAMLNRLNANRGNRDALPALLREGSGIGCSWGDMARASGLARETVKRIIVAHMTATRATASTDPTTTNGANEVAPDNTPSPSTEKDQAQ